MWEWMHLPSTHGTSHQQHRFNANHERNSKEVIMIDTVNGRSVLARIGPLDPDLTGRQPKIAQATAVELVC